MKRLFWAIFLILMMGCHTADKNFDTPKNKNKQPPKQPEIIESLSTFIEREIQEITNRTQQDGKKYRIIVGNFQLNNSEVSSEFADYLSNEISAYISRQRSLEEVNRANLKELQKEQALALSPFFKSVKSSAESPVGKLLAADGILTGSYWLSGEKVKIYLKLLDVKTSQNTYTASGQVSAPDGIEIIPNNFIVAENDKSLQQRRDFGFSVWTDKGKGAIYQDGETLKIFFRSSKDCYAKVYHISVSGKITLVYPDNAAKTQQIKAGEVFQIPEEFEASQPYGVETLKAIVGSEPFSEIEEYFTEVGNADDMSVWQKIYNSAQGNVSQDSCFYTVVK